MTRRRPWWSEWFRQWARFLCALCLSGSALAAGPVDLVVDAWHGLSGLASYYGGKFHGRRTANGERFDKQEFTGASNHFPLGSMVAVRRPDNGMCAMVRINDRMHPRHRKRVIDVSRSVGEYLGMLRAGVVRVQVAPLHEDWEQRGALACEDAFQPDDRCPDCQPEDGFGGEMVRP